MATTRTRAIWTVITTQDGADTHTAHHNYTNVPGDGPIEPEHAGALAYSHFWALDTVLRDREYAFRDEGAR